MESNIQVISRVFKNLIFALVNFKEELGKHQSYEEQILLRDVLRLQRKKKIMKNYVQLRLNYGRKNRNSCHQIFGIQSQVIFFKIMSKSNNFLNKLEDQKKEFDEAKLTLNQDKIQLKNDLSDLKQELTTLKSKTKKEISGKAISQSLYRPHRSTAFQNQPIRNLIRHPF